MNSFGARSRLRHRAAALPFRPVSDWMVGVDLSPAMLAQARAKGLYDRLVEAEVLRFLADEAALKARYHLILAGDVFVYLDDLRLFCALRHRCWRRTPCWRSASRPMTVTASLLRETLRYAHGEAQCKPRWSRPG